MKTIETTTLLAAPAAIAAALYQGPLALASGLTFTIVATAAVLALLRLVRNPFRWQMIPAYLAILAALVTVIFDTGFETLTTHLSAAAAWSACGLSVLLTIGFPLVRLPAPDGPFAVGGFVTELTRETEDSESRRLRVKVWYPAQKGADVDGSYEPLWAEFYAANVPLFLRLALGYLREVETHTLPRARFFNDGAECPVIVYNHALVSIASDNTLLMELLASHGFIVIGVAHTDQAVEYQQIQRSISAEERMRDKALYAKLRTVTNRAERAALFLDLYRQSTGMPLIVRRRSADSAFVLDNMDSILASIPNYARAPGGASCAIAAVGFSLGGAVATHWCRSDARCAAVVNMDGGLFGDRLLEPVEVPYLMLYSELSVGSNDFLKQVSGGVFEEAVLPGTRHLDFNDGTVLWRLLKWLGVLGPASGIDIARIRNDRIHIFLDRHLKETAAGTAGHRTEARRLP